MRFVCVVIPNKNNLAKFRCINIYFDGLCKNLSHQRSFFCLITYQLAFARWFLAITYILMFLLMFPVRQVLKSGLSTKCKIPLALLVTSISLLVIVAWGIRLDLSSLRMSLDTVVGWKLGPVLVGGLQSPRPRVMS